MTDTTHLSFNSDDVTLFAHPSDLEKDLNRLQKERLTAQEKTRQNAVHYLSDIRQEKVTTEKEDTLKRRQLRQSSDTYDTYLREPFLVNDPKLRQIYTAKKNAEEKLKKPWQRLLNGKKYRTDISVYDATIANLTSTNLQLTDEIRELYEYSATLSDRYKDVIQSFIIQTFNNYQPLRNRLQSDDCLEYFSNRIVIDFLKNDKVFANNDLYMGEDGLDANQKKEYLKLVLTAFKTGSTDYDASKTIPNDDVKDNNAKRRDYKRQGWTDYFDNALFHGVQTSKFDDFKKFASVVINELAFADIKAFLNQLSATEVDTNFSHYLKDCLAKKDYGANQIHDDIKRKKDNNVALTPEQNDYLLTTDRRFDRTEDLARSFIEASEIRYIPYQHGLDAWPALSDLLLHTKVTSEADIQAFEQRYIEACSVWSKKSAGFNTDMLIQMRNALEPVNFANFLVPFLLQHGTKAKPLHHTAVDGAYFLNQSLSSLDESCYSRLLTLTSPDLHDNLNILIDPESPFQALPDNDEKLAVIANIISGRQDAVLIEKIARHIKDTEGNPYKALPLYEYHYPSIELQDALIENASFIAMEINSTSPSGQKTHLYPVLRAVCFNEDRFVAICQHQLSELGYTIDTEDLQGLAVHQRAQLLQSMLKNIDNVHRNGETLEFGKLNDDIRSSSFGTDQRFLISPNSKKIADQIEKNCVIFAEFHDDTDDTKTEIEVMSALKDQGFGYAAFELPYDHQPYADAYFSGQMTEDEFLGYTQISLIEDPQQTECWIKKLNTAKQLGYSPIFFDKSAVELDLIAHLVDRNDSEAMMKVLINRNEFWKKVIQTQQKADPDGKIVMIAGWDHVLGPQPIQQQLHDIGIKTDVINLHSNLNFYTQNMDTIIQPPQKSAPQNNILRGYYKDLENHDKNDFQLPS